MMIAFIGIIASTASVIGIFLLCCAVAEKNTRNNYSFEKTKAELELMGTSEEHPVCRACLSAKALAPAKAPQPVTNFEKDKPRVYGWMEEDKLVFEGKPNPDIHGWDVMFENFS